MCVSAHIQDGVGGVVYHLLCAVTSATHHLPFFGKSYLSAWKQNNPNCLYIFPPLLSIVLLGGSSTDNG